MGGIYKAPVNYVPHDFNSSTVLVNDVHTVEGIHTWEVEMREDATDVQSVADGTSILVENPVTAGEFRFSHLAGSATSNYMWDLLASGGTFNVSFTDSNSPNLKANGQKCKVMKAPNIVGSKEAPMHEWTMVCPYVIARGGSIKLQES